jgi:hypothetical protein
MQPVLLRLVLAGNLEKSIMSLYGTEWRERDFRLRLDYKEFESTSESVLRNGIRDPRSGAFMTPGFGIRDGKKIRIEIRNKHFGSYFQEMSNNFWGLKLKIKILKFFVARCFFIPDPVSGVFGILDKHPASATLLVTKHIRAEMYSTLPRILLTTALYRAEAMRTTRGYSTSSIYTVNSKHCIKKSDSMPPNV